jgi:hypothetical protein
MGPRCVTGDEGLGSRIGPARATLAGAGQVNQAHGLKARSTRIDAGGLYYRAAGRYCRLLLQLVATRSCYIRVMIKLRLAI